MNIDGIHHIAIARDRQNDPSPRRWCAICHGEIFFTSHGWVHRHLYAPSNKPIGRPACVICGRVLFSLAHRQDGPP